MTQGGQEVTLRLQPNALVTLSGTVCDEKGQPLPNAKVTLVEWWLDMGLSGAMVRTDAQGRYAFDALFADSRYSLSSAAPGYGAGQTKAAEFKPGEKGEMEPMRLRRADSFIAGRVVDDNGDPVARHTVVVQGLATETREILTDAGGRFRFDGLVNELLTLYLREDNGMTQHLKRVQAGQNDVILVWKPARPATGTPQDQGGCPQAADGPHRDARTGARYNGLAQHECGHAGRPPG